jgi:glycosyltransferase involved in cell wall biosynthesis
MVTPPKKIAILAPSVPPVSQGGIASAHEQLAHLLSRMGMDVRIYTFADFGPARFFKDQNSKVFRFGSSLWIARAIQVVFKLFWILREKRLSLRSYQTADVFKTRLGCLKLEKQIKNWNPEVIVFPDQGAPAFWLRNAKRKNQIWISIQHHHPMRFLGQPEFGLHSPRDARMAFQLEARGLEYIDYVLCPSGAMAEFFLKSFALEIPRLTQRLRVIPNLMEPSLIRSILSGVQREQTLRKVKVYIPSAGSRFKGSDVLLDLLEAIKTEADRVQLSVPLEFYLSGSIPTQLLGAVREWSSRQRQMTIESPGALTHREHLERVAQCDLCVSPTWIDNYSMAILEAQALGLPALSFDVGGNRDLIPADGTLGSLVPRGDVIALAKEAILWASRLQDRPKLLKDQIVETIAKRLESTETLTREFFNEI